MMFKKSLLLSLFLLLIPGCKKNRYTPGPAPVVGEPTTAPEKAVYDEELGAYVVKEDDNKFSAATAAQAQQEEELSAVAPETGIGDLQADSAKYGLKTLYFGYDLWKVKDLKPDQRRALENNLAIVKSLADKGYKIAIQGHACDSGGDTDYNMALSHKRADIVADYFKTHGVEAAFNVMGYGSEHKIVPSGDREQQAPNRRVEIYAYPPAA